VDASQFDALVKALSRTLLSRRSRRTFGASLVALPGSVALGWVASAKRKRRKHKGKRKKKNKKKRKRTNATPDCVPDKTTACAGRECGNAVNNCDQTISCGSCADNESCQGGDCICDPDCAANACGDDGCGGSCGTCADNETCEGGNCVCAAGFLDCGSGCIAGDCCGDSDCRNGRACQGNQCKCPASQVDCGQGCQTGVCCEPIDCPEVLCQAVERCVDRQCEYAPTSDQNCDGICCAGECIDGGQCCAGDDCPDPEVCKVKACTGNQCLPTDAPDGAPCDAGNPCTAGDTCQAGVCSGGDPVTCGATECQNPGTCDPGTGGCSDPTNKPNGTACRAEAPAATGSAAPVAVAVMGHAGPAGCS
jgi:hypothetical protein